MRGLEEVRWQNACYRQGQDEIQMWVRLRNAYTVVHKTFSSNLVNVKKEVVEAAIENCATLKL